MCIRDSANPHVLDKVKVDYYGVATPVAQVGNVSVPEARTIMIQPWEPNLLKEIEKAILAVSYTHLWHFGLALQFYV